jgi:enoyl-CoA hydratase/carnithine racemase
VTPELVLDRRGASLVVRLNRPEARNALTPELLNGIGSAADATRAWDRLGELQTVVFGSEDAKEGAMAFVEKRQPQWTGA